jgi:phenylpyruvate tautomerase PptA (4-oxalocrotonate tautomerase family)
LLIDDIASAFAKAAGDAKYKQRVTVVIEEVPNENWGRAGKQVQPDGSVGREEAALACFPEIGAILRADPPPF